MSCDLLLSAHSAKCVYHIYSNKVARSNIQASNIQAKTSLFIVHFMSSLPLVRFSTRADIFRVWGLDFLTFDSLNLFDLFCVGFVVRNQGRAGSAWKMLVSWSWRSFVRPDMRCSGLVAYDVADTRWNEQISTDLQTQRSINMIWNVLQAVLHVKHSETLETRRFHW